MAWSCSAVHYDTAVSFKFVCCTHVELADPTGDQFGAADTQPGSVDTGIYYSGAISDFQG